MIFDIFQTVSMLMVSGLGCRWRQGEPDQTGGKRETCQGVAGDLEGNKYLAEQTAGVLTRDPAAGRRTEVRSRRTQTQAESRAGTELLEVRTSHQEQGRLEERSSRRNNELGLS